MSEDLISKEKAYEVLTEYYHHKTEMQHKALRIALDMVPSVDIDLADYSDRLWRKAYEQGKAVSKDALDEAYAHGYTAAEADFHKQNQWIPATERLPEPVAPSQRREWFLTSNQYGGVNLTCYEFETSPFREGWQTDMTILAWMPLPKPWKGGAE